MFNSRSNYLSVGYVVPSERTVVNKERAAGYYRLSAYYLAKLFSELPLVLCQPTLFYTAVYWMTGLNRSESFLGGLFVLLLTAITGQVQPSLICTDIWHMISKSSDNYLLGEEKC